MRVRSLATIKYRVFLLGWLWLGPTTVWADAAPQNRPVGWSDWNLDPVIWLNLSLLLWLYGRGLLSLRDAGIWSNRTSPDLAHQSQRTGRVAFSTRINLHSIAAFFVGYLLLAISLLSPIDPLGGQLGWVHMIQHMVVMTVAVPLLILGLPGLVCLRGLPAFSRRWVGRGKRILDQSVGPWLWSAGLAWAVYAIATWAWHLPALYGAALRWTFAHDLQHLSFFAAAWLFWRPLLDPRRRDQMPAGVAVFYLMTTTLHVTVLGVLMTVAPVPWYEGYAVTTPLWGWSPLEDQQMAGLIMWMPACLPYLVAAVWIFARSIWQPENSQVRSVIPTNS